MCGIGGILRLDDAPIAPGRLTAMRDALAHRGPDGRGVSVLGRCGLVHTRLSIIDPARGHQPMVAPALDLSREDRGELAIVFNGEIYNHRDLRHELQAAGHRFQTDHCDTEVLLHGLRQWGIEGLAPRLRGMFAFAIWDARRGRLVLARDRAGKKPLWLHRRRGEILFASEIAPLLAALPGPDRPGVDYGALGLFLRLGYTAGASLLQGVEELPAGSWMVIDAQGSATAERFWRLPATGPGNGAVAASRLTDADSLRDAATELIADAVAARLEADAPLGCFLSGGIDSSLVAALAQAQLRRQGGDVLQTFSVAMPDATYDESPFARQVALHIGSRHTELPADPEQDVLGDLANLIRLSGEPTADSSLLPTYWLSRATRRHVAVALSGDGGDELFAGYDRYRAMRLLELHAIWLRRLPRSLLGSNRPYSRRARLRRLAEAAEQASPAGRYLSMVQIFSQQQADSLWPGASALASGSAPEQAMGGDLDGRGWRDDPDPAVAAMRWDFHNYLPFDLLRKVDRASMAVGLEVRCPMLDASVCEFATRLPGQVRLPAGRPKAVLRAVAAPLLPREIIDRPKRGFAVPIGPWFRGPLRERLRAAILDPGPVGLASLGFDLSFIEQIESRHAAGQADHTHRLFALLSLALWHREIASPSGPPPRDH